MNELKLAWYGDDFTGSTDVMETLALAGLRAVLFLAPPEPEVLKARFSDVQALGVAGISRALPTDQLASGLEPVFAALAKIEAHPVTPMLEADLRMHLAEQTTLPIRHVDLTSFGEHFMDRVNHACQATGETGPPIVLFDCCIEEHLEQLGELLWNGTGRRLVVGSSGVEHGLVSYLQHRELLPSYGRGNSSAPKAYPRPIYLAM